MTSRFFATRNDNHLPPGTPMGDALVLVKRMTPEDYPPSLPEASAALNQPPKDEIALAVWYRDELNRMADENKISFGLYVPEGGSRPRLKVNKLKARTTYDEEELD